MYLTLCRNRVYLHLQVHNMEKIMTDYRDIAMKLVDDQVIDTKYLLVACLKYMSQDEVRDMLNLNVDSVVFE